MTFKIAMVAPYPESPGLIKGGVECVTSNLVEGLRKIPGLELSVLAPCGNRAPGIEHRGDITIYWLPESRLPGFISYWSSYRRTIQRCLSEINPDMTHFQGVAGWTFGYSSPYVLTIHGINEKDALFSRGRLRFLRYKVVGLVERLGRKKADNIILISRYVEKEIGEQLMGKCWPIENPVSDDFYEVELGSTAPTILYAGHVKSQKNVDNLIRAFKGVHAEIPSATLRIAGPLDDQKFVNKCRKLVNDLELDTAVQFLGNLSRSALLIELSQAACLALVSHQENAPMVIEEAMAAGVPVVASRICGIPYMIQDGKTGFLVDQNDNDDITDRLIKVLLESVTSCAMSEQSREVALSRFHVQAVAKKTVETYRAIVGDGVWKEGMKNVQNL